MKVTHGWEMAFVVSGTLMKVAHGLKCSLHLQASPHLPHMACDIPDIIQAFPTSV